MNTKVKIAGVEFKNPVMTASGTFGSGMEYDEFVDLNKLGGVVTKGVANVPWPGNPTPRVAEVYGGMLNAIGLQNPGIDVLVKQKLPALRKVYKGCIIVNISGFSIDEYVECCAKADASPDVDIIEVNVSCPNVHNGCMSFGTSAEGIASVTKAVKAVTTKPVYIKLTPNVTDIVSIAKACEDAGADGISLINTLLGMRIDLKTKKPVIANVMGGFSGPAVFPVALRMVYQVAHAVSIPVVGLGGVSSAYDVIEMMLAGATAVEGGSANLTDPFACKKIIEEFKA